jgi:hypothetical protein
MCDNYEGLKNIVSSLFIYILLEFTLTYIMSTLEFQVGTLLSTDPSSKPGQSCSGPVIYRQIVIKKQVHVSH